MYDEYSHPLLAQVPLTVSPFVSLPTATTLPYTYKSLPSTLPPSSTEGSAAETPGEGEASKPKFVVSASGHAAHPDDITASCQALEAHLRADREEAERTVLEWENGIKERELAEKRRVAPGWLDRSEKMLQPEAARSQPSASLLDSASADGLPTVDVTGAESDDAMGKELDRAFGDMKAT